MKKHRCQPPHDVRVQAAAGTLRCGVTPVDALPPDAIAGIDEAGRGCLAGPVVAAAVVLPAVYALPHLTDSKALRPEQRAALAAGIRLQAVAWGIGIVWQRDIDRLNILQATFHAMSRAVHSLRIRPPRAQGQHAPSRAFTPALLRVDGNKTIPPAVLARYGTTATPLCAVPQEAIIDGDALIPCISAASILAKTCRDRLLVHLHRRWPVYDFARHKGYGTTAHRAALAAHGPCPLHRLTFGGVRPPDQSADDVRRALGLLPDVTVPPKAAPRKRRATTATAVQLPLLGED